MSMYHQASWDDLLKRKKQSKTLSEILKLKSGDLYPPENVSITEEEYNSLVEEEKRLYAWSHSGGGAWGSRKRPID